MNNQTNPEPESSQEALEENRRDFEKAISWGKDLTKRLLQDGAKLTHVRPVFGESVWFLRVLLPTAIQEGFGTAPEVLIVALHGQTQAKDLERAHAELYRAGFRLDLDLLVFVDDHPDLESRLGRLPGRWGQFVPWPPSKNGFPSLSEQFSASLPRFDLFEEKNPVRGRHVIGRTDEIADITTRVENGECVGVFGLRKVGKTTVVRAVTDALDPISARLSLRRLEIAQTENLEPRAIVAWLDAQRLYNRTGERLLASLVDSIEKRLKAGNITYTKPSSSEPLEQIDQLLSNILSTTTVPLCIVLDEYDFLFEGSGGQPPIPGVHALFQLLRGVSQETQRLSVVVIGRDPSFFQRPEMGGFPNPLLGWFATHWIGPLRQDKAPELLRKLGKRVGLDIGHQTAKLAQTWTGGHPLLHRQFGSALLEITRKSKYKGHVATDSFCLKAIDPFQERDTVRDVCNEILHLLWARYRSSYELVRSISQGLSIKGAIEKQGGWNSDAAMILRKYGILTPEQEEPRIFQALTSYTKSFEPPTIPTPSAQTARIETNQAPSPKSPAKVSTRPSSAPLKFRPLEAIIKSATSESASPPGSPTKKPNK